MLFLCFVLHYILYFILFSNWHMLPFFEIFSGFIVYTFWLALILCLFLFTVMFKKLSSRFAYSHELITKNILWYFLGVFIGARIFYVIAKWSELKYIANPFEFFISNDYNFSLMWAIIGFMTVLVFNLKKQGKTINGYIDGVMTSLLFILPVGYLWAFLWGQVYGRETFIGIEVLYSHPFTPVPFEIPVFPLPLVYALLFFILFCGAYIGSLFIHSKGFIGYMSAIVGSSILLIFEFFSGKYDIFKDTIGINMTQLIALIIIGTCVHWLYHLYKK